MLWQYSRILLADLRSYDRILSFASGLDPTKCSNGSATNTYKIIVYLFSNR